MYLVINQTRDQELPFCVDYLHLILISHWFSLCNSLDDAPPLQAQNHV